MKKIAQIIADFNQRTKTVKNSNLDKVNKLKESIRIARNCLLQLRLELRKSGFSSKKDEITFFKYQKPHIQGRLNFYLKLNSFIVAYPIVDDTNQRSFILNELAKIDNEKKEYLDFLKYYKFKETKLDYLYFLRNNNQLNLFINATYHIEDPEFSTSHDHLVSEIITNDLLTKFYTKQLNEISSNQNKPGTKELRPDILKDLNWTASKTDLAELLYALNAAGAIKNGKAEMKKLVKVCKALFGIDLGNVYKTYSEIKLREKDPTKFLDLMKVRLTQKIKSEL